MGYKNEVVELPYWVAEVGCILTVLGAIAFAMWSIKNLTKKK